MELIEQARTAEKDVEVFDEKTFPEELVKQRKQNGHFPFALFDGMFSAEVFNSLITQALREMRVGTVISVSSGHVVLAIDEKGIAPEVLIPVAQIRRLEKGGNIFNMR